MVSLVFFSLFARTFIRSILFSDGTGYTILVAKLLEDET